MLQKIVTRCGLLVLFAVSACFSPKFEDGKIACGPDDSCPPGQSCFNGVCSAEDPGTIDARGDAGIDAAIDAMIDAAIDAPPANVTLTITYSGTGKGSVSGTGLTCNAGGCTGSFAPNTTVTITQSPMTGSDFSTWEGACATAGTNAQCTLTLTADTTTNAVFTLKSYRLTVAMSGNGTGMVTGNGISCSQSGATTTGTCTVSLDHGTSVTLMQGGAGQGSSFLGWSGASCTGTGSTCSFIMEGITTINAPFGLNNTLVVSGAGNGVGSIASQNDASINCTSTNGTTSGTCSHTYGATTNVTLLATPDATSTFAGWTGGGCTTNPCTVTVAAAVGVTATFALKKYTVTISKANNGADTGTGIVTGSGISCGASCSVMVDHGTQITFTQVPSTGSMFQGWASTPTTAGCTGTANCTVTVTADTNITASYLLTKYAVSVAANPANGSRGTITSNIGGINCPSGNCTANLNHGSMVTLTAAPVTGNKFKDWTNGPCAGMSTPMCAFTVTAATAMTANFEPAPFDLTVQTTGNGAGMVTASAGGLMCVTGSTANCTKTYLFGDMITLTATPSSDSTFTGFSGGGCGSGTTCVVSINAAVTVQASFTLKQYALTVTKDPSGTGTGTVTSNVGGINCGTTCTSSNLDHGTMVTLTATPNTPSSAFAGWTGGACSGTSTTCVVTMDAAKSATAKFNTATYLVRIDKQGNGFGTVTSGTIINCGSDCTETLAYGSTITLTATPTGQATLSQWSVFKGWNQAGCTGTGSCTVTVTGAMSIQPTFDLRPNDAFITNTPPNAPIGSLAAADMYCKQVANTAIANSTLSPGTYTAWLSSSSASALSRLGSASGWVRTDGKVVARSQEDLIAGKLLFPLRISESRSDLGAVNAMTGTAATGLATTNTCTDWTSSIGSGTVGRAYGLTGMWTNHGTSGCVTDTRIYCLGVDRDADLPPLVTPGGRIAFVSGNSWNPSTGIAAADTQCANEAASAGLSGSFKALLATTTSTALSRFNTASNSAPWQRVDGARIATTAANLNAALLDTAINVTAAGAYVGNSGVWTGANGSLTANGTNATTCNNWTFNTGTTTGEAGTAADSTNGAFYDGTPAACNASFRIYCLQE
ncbi:MAG: hypothetical protein SFX73_20140 [Kofleriaceae bacterium]|nr:hypothetical protein [Kofleriaceae bacterium]